MMGIWLLTFLALGDDGFVLERNVKVWSADTLGRLREIHRRERVKYQDGNLLVEDLTFGEKLLIRTDKRTVWRVDPLAGTYSELTFDQVRARQEEVLKEIRSVRERVKGAPDDEELKWLLQGYGWFDSAPTIEVRSSGKRATIAGRGVSANDLILNGNIYLFSEVYVDPSLPTSGYFETLGRISTYPEPLLQRFKEVGGIPLRGRMSHVLFLDRIRSEEEVTSIAAASIPITEFEPPTGLQRIPLKNFEKPEPRKVEKPKELQKSFKEDDIDREQNPLREGDKKEPK